ncbi:potassium channel family protein [Streptomyces sp. NPDC088789]|uniref:potassium channel family protein n=1 Tax=Streptomyces sp. NPDC088789 TaxID=3365899 RepID=UPI00381658AB
MLVADAVLVTAYYLLPLEHASAGTVALILAVGLALLIVLVVFQVRLIMFTPHPSLRAVEAVTVSVPLVLLLFASGYAAMSTISAGSFGGPMSHTAALYFTVTVFSTVGFGDITAKTDAARLVVTAQMVVNIVITGFVVKAFSFMVKARREHQPTADSRRGDRARARRRHLTRPTAAHGSRYRVSLLRRMMQRRSTGG